jgi:gliding motility-associated-like protein
VSGTGVYSGPGTTAAGIFTPTAAGVGNHTIWYKFTTPNGCVDSISQTILVKAKPIVSYTFPAGGCLPTSGFAQFNGNAGLSDGQTVSTWAWNFGDPNATVGNPNTSSIQNPSHNFIANGTYTVQLSVLSSGGCSGDTSIVHNFNTKPSLAYPALNSVCVNAGGTVNVATASVTNGVSGTGVYSGPGTTAAGIFTPSVAGVGTQTIWYKFTTPNGCVDSISQTILVKAKPVVSYTFPTGGCLPTTGLAQFNGNAALSDGQTVTTWAWNFNDPNANAGNPNTSSIQNPTHNFTANGIYNVQLVVTSSGGCSGDTTIQHNFNIKPALAYPALNSVCVNAGGTVNVASASVTNGASGTGVYSGPGTTAAGIFTPSVAGVGTQTIWYKFTTPNGCVDSISQTILVKAKPVVSYTFPTGGCLPTTGLAQFNGNAALSDGQTVTIWAWNFNDPNATVGNPNTSGLQNPTHNYSANGIYNVNLTVTSSGGCTGDTTIPHNFNLKPALAYPPLPTICQSIVGTVNVATASVTNGAAGTGVYSGPGTNAAGQFSPSAAGSGTHTIWYKFTTPNGCVDSISQTIAVDPKPVASFTVTPSVCLGDPVSFTDGSTISGGTIVQWQWIFGNGNTANNNNGNPFVFLYGADNNYTIKLVTVSANGCISDTATRTTVVNPIPVADFGTSASVCMPGGAVNFTNQSTLTPAGGLTYTWDFGDLSAPATATNPSHVYAAINSYNITLTATSAAGCSDDITKPFSAFFVKPIADFDPDPDVLCQGKPTTFTDLSTDPGGSTITNWVWNFADGSAPSTATAPVKTFAQPGNYNVTLRVTNAAGCISDAVSRPVTVFLQPVVDAGPSFTALQGATVTFNPVVNDPNLTFVWSPSFGLSSAGAIRPSLVVNFDQVYTLTATGQGGCTASDVLTVKVLKKVNIPNAFSPNGDGINDRWDIENLPDYLDCDVQVFNRYGQRIYQSRGYGKTWDGTVNGSPLPVGVYYYIIDLKNGLQKLNGSVTIVR